MLRKLRIKGLRGQEREYDFGEINRLLGRNGAGKSTIKEALALVFAGTDSAGNRAPVHLITAGEEKLEVLVWTDKATLRRSLTRRKNGTLMLERAGTLTELSQQEMAKLVGPPDVFLSVFLPGYFFTINGERRKAVLSHVLPEQHPHFVLEQLCGFQLTDDEIRGLDWKKRGDILADHVAGRRRTVQSELDQLLGRLSQLRQAQDPGPRPPAAGDAADLGRWGKLRDAWNFYHSAARERDQLVRFNQSIAESNRRTEDRHAALVSELGALTTPNADLAAAELQAVRDQLSQMRASVKPAPPGPRTSEVPDAPSCPACGQIVGSKHRARVAQQNEEAWQAWRDQCAQAEAYNRDVAGAVQDLERQERKKLDAHDAALREALRVESRARFINEELKRLVYAEPRPDFDLPPPPGEPYDEEAHKRAKAEFDAYQRAVGAWEHQHRQYAGASAMVGELEQQGQALQGSIERLRVLEQNLRVLPEELLRRQMSLLSMENYELVIDDLVTLRHKDGRPYEVLSTGEKMRADIALAVKIDSLMGRPVKMHFIDNAELLDELQLQMDGRQIFAAYVSRDHKQVEVQVG